MTTPTLLSIDTKLKALRTQWNALTALEEALEENPLTPDSDLGAIDKLCAELCTKIHRLEVQYHETRAHQEHLIRMAWQSERARSSYTQ